MTLGGQLRAGRGAVALAALLGALALAALIPTTAGAFVGCTRSESTLSAFATSEDDRITIVRGGDAINVLASLDYGDSDILLACSGGISTVTNTDAISIQNGPADFAPSATIDLSGGPLAPGATAEPDGSPEIEIQARPSGRSGVLGIFGSSGPDAFDFGRTAAGTLAINLNAAEAVADADLELIGNEVPTTLGREGPDVFRAQGAPGFAGPFSAAFFASGGKGADTIGAGTRLSYMLDGRGNDRIFGGTGRDIVVASEGRDRIVTGPGADIVLSEEGGRDRVNCGGGKDLAVIDRRDKGRSCKRVRDRELDNVRLKLTPAQLAAAGALFEYLGD